MVSLFPGGHPGGGLRDFARVELTQPTNPDSANESSASSTHMDSTLMPPSHGLPTTLPGMGGSNGALTPGGTPSIGAGPGPLIGMTYDTLGELEAPYYWHLDGLLNFDWPYQQAGLMEPV